MRVKFARKDTETLDNRCSTALSKVCGMIESNASTSCDDGQVAIVDCAIVNIFLSKRAQERLQSANISTRDLDGAFEQQLTSCCICGAISMCLREVTLLKNMSIS